MYELWGRGPCAGRKGGGKVPSAGQGTPTLTGGRPKTPKNMGRENGPLGHSSQEENMFEALKNVVPLSAGPIVPGEKSVIFDPSFPVM